MERSKILGLPLLMLFLLLGLCNISMSVVDKKIKQQQKLEKKTYIVHMAKSEMPATFDEHAHWYASSLKSVSDSAEMLYTYNNAIHGFSTRLTDQEAKSLEGLPGILAIMPQMRYELHTTRTPLFLGLDKNDGFMPQSDSTSEMVVGVLDTGAWPESQSFDDKGLGPVPSSWKGQCELGKNFNASSCNRKLIGARFFSKGYEATLGPIDETKESKSPRDDDGHGTHTSTTAAGSVVEGASLFGYASGAARGMAARARVATYKVCWLGGCFSADILAGMDKAIEDGVNVISMSLGGGMSDYYRDSLAIGAFTAMERGILVSCSAGNAGPSTFSLSNVAPWITTVGAGTLDRDFPAYVSLGNGKNFSGVSLYSGKPLTDSLLPFIYAGNATNSTNGNLCITGTLIPSKVAGKIVLCDRGVNARVQKGTVVKEAGGVGMILANTEANGEELVADAHLLPATGVTEKTGNIIKSYLSSDANPTATITFGGTKVGIQPSPVVAAFSSRGPNSITPDILKPDIIAPGVNILAGWTGAAGPTGLSVDTRRVGFNIVSGTSMSCPHVSGLAARLKAAHPDWSPGAVRSALMTTAYATYKTGETLQDIATGKASTPFDYGSGHVDPVSALDPGLVYDLAVEDYVGFLCALNYSQVQITLVARRNFTCDTNKKYSVSDLNYPSFAVPFGTAIEGGASASASATSIVKHTRTLTNVGSSATYKVSVSSETESVKITVQPESLTFSAPNEKKTYTVTFTGLSMPSGTTSFARLEWSDGKHIVGSPIAFTWT
ncbi:subtilisin-like protease SBT1.7 [Telopea speciosissima]|uniref:subtilisin-like protease SBT1.7 n=1 Tax=Telopea speciosissima TaxID=54955 RepID=UPI001CC773C2|nr:subtilisin-like protease SBT1.7 [Telopea speciosissima]